MFSIYHDFKINASKEKVFEAFANPIHLNNWWTLKSSGNPTLGVTYNLNFTDKYNWFAKVGKVKENEYFYLTMVEASEDWLPTTFGITLEEVEQGTLVKFSHTGWLAQNSEYRISSFCWALLLKGLKDYVEKEIVIPFEQRN